MFYLDFGDGKQTISF